MCEECVGPFPCPEKQALVFTEDYKFCSYFGSFFLVYLNVFHIAQTVIFFYFLTISLLSLVFTFLGKRGNHGGESSLKREDNMFTSGAVSQKSNS